MASIPQVWSHRNKIKEPDMKRRWVFNGRWFSRQTPSRRSILKIGDPKCQIGDPNHDVKLFWSVRTRSNNQFFDSVRSLCCRTEVRFCVRLVRRCTAFGNVLIRSWIMADRTIPVTMVLIFRFRMFVFVCIFLIPTSPFWIDSRLFPISLFLFELQIWVVKLAMKVCIRWFVEVFVGGYKVGWWLRNKNWWLKVVELLMW